jgi:hypothetical protein
LLSLIADIVSVLDNKIPDKQMGCCSRNGPFSYKAQPRPPLWSCDKERRISDNKAFVFMTGSEGDVSGAAARLVTRKEGILLTTLLSL